MIFFKRFILPLFVSLFFSLSLLLSFSSPAFSETYYDSLIPPGDMPPLCNRAFIKSLDACRANYYFDCTGYYGAPSGDLASLCGYLFPRWDAQTMDVSMDGESSSSGELDLSQGLADVLARALFVGLFHFVCFAVTFVLAPLAFH